MGPYNVEQGSHATSKCGVCILAEESEDRGTSGPTTRQASVVKVEGADKRKTRQGYLYNDHVMIPMQLE
jgi:hypothetical protein